MALESIDSFTQGKITARLINASPTSQAKIINGSGSKLFYKTASDVDTEDTEIAVGSSATVEQVVWIISAGRSNVLIEHPTGLAPEDVVIGDDLTVKDTLTVKGATTLEAAATVGTTLGVTGITTPTGGIAPASQAPGFWAGNYAPGTAETGTDLALAEKKLFVTSIFLPVNKEITGIGFLLGAGGGTTKVVLGLFNSKGEVVGKTSETTEGTVAGTEKTIQEIALTAKYKAVGPALYFVGITGNGTTAHIRTIPANTAGANVFAGEVELTEKNKLAKITAPSTFTGGKGVVAFVY
jgi:hypothetical protein